MQLFGITLTEIKISGLFNIFISSFSISTIINLLETMI
jgi:hypothetical protein